MVSHRPLLPVLFEIPKHHCSGLVTFLVDSGATNSILTEKDALIIGLDCSLFPECNQLSIGFGGTFRNRMINCPVKLIFGADKQKYTLTYDGGFRILTIPPHLTAQEKETVIRSTPSVLGMGVIRDFKMYLDKNKVELTI